MSSPIESPKLCAACGTPFARRKGASRTEWARRKFCSFGCSQATLTETRRQSAVERTQEAKKRKELEQAPLVADASCHRYLDTCRYTLCRYHLERDDSKRARNNIGSLHGARIASRNHSGVTETCALRVASKGEHSLEEVGEYYGVTKSQAQVIVEEALIKLKRKAENGELRLLRELR